MNKKYSQYIIDAHAHYGYWPTLKEAEKALLISTEKNRIDFTLLSFDGSEFKDSSPSKRFTPQIESSKKALALANKYPSHFGILLWFRPYFEKNIGDLQAFYLKNREKIYGLKFHPYSSRLKITDKKVRPYLDMAREYKLPVLVHTAVDEYSDIKYLVEVAKEYPDVKFIAAHCVLLSDHYEMIDILKENPNIYCDTAWVDMEFIKVLDKNGLINRVMFGTDNPIDGIETLSNPLYQDYFNNKIKLGYYKYAKLMYKNALKIYGIDYSILKKK